MVMANITIIISILVESKFKCIYYTVFQIATNN